MPEHHRSGDTDYITRADLEMHCGHIHDPLLETVKDTRLWVGKLDSRMWGLLIGVLFAILAGAINIYVGVTTKSAVTAESRRAMRYERAQEAPIAGTVVK